MTQKEKEKMIQINKNFVQTCINEYYMQGGSLNKNLLNVPFKILGVPEDLSLKEKMSYFQLMYNNQKDSP